VDERAALALVSGFDWIQDFQVPHRIEEIGKSRRRQRLGAFAQTSHAQINRYTPKELSDEFDA
jgi:hypothetical protein